MSQSHARRLLVGFTTARQLSLTFGLGSLVLFASACLPTYDPEDAQFSGGSSSCRNPAQEVCDGDDNDCDGAVDEDFPRRGLSCGQNIGVCTSVYICEDGVETCFALAEAGEEACDGLDNDCDGQTDEVTLTDPQNCGRCGFVCEFANGISACEEGLCLLGGCNAGFENCDGDDVNGCETDTTSDPVNCGGCGNICGDDSAQTVCTNGECSIQMCLNDRTDCNMFPLDGCEADLTADLFNCGSCGETCAFDNAAAMCVESSCSFASCLDGFADRDVNQVNGCEVGIRLAGSPPDANLTNLASSENWLLGSAGNSLFGYRLTAQGAIGPLTFSQQTTSPVNQISATGDTAYVSLAAGDIVILDLANPEDVVTESVVITSGPAPGFARAGSMLYVADGRDGLRVVSVADPAAPQLVGRASAPDLVTQVVASSSRAVLWDSASPILHIFDINNPSQPVLLASPEVEMPFNRAVISGDLLVTGVTGQAAIRIYRLSDTGALTFLGSTDLPGGLADFQQRFPFLVAVSAASGGSVAVVLLDIRRPQRPSLTTNFQTGVPNMPRSASFADDQIYVAGAAGLQRFDITDVRSPVSAQDLVRPTFLRDLTIDGNTLFVSADGSVEVLDITDPQNPNRIARFGMGVQRVAVGGGSLFVTSDTTPVAKYSIGTLNDAPVPVATFDDPAHRPAFMVASEDGSYAFGYLNGRFKSIPFNGGIFADVLLNATCYDMVRNGTFVYLACSTGLIVVNATDPANPTVGAPLGGTPIYDLYLLGMTLHAVGDNTILTFQVQLPGTLNLLTTIAYDQVAGLRKLAGVGLWLVASNGTQLILFDRMNLTSPEFVVTRTLGTATVDMVPSSEFVYAGTNDGVFRLAIEAPQ